MKSKIGKKLVEEITDKIRELDKQAKLLSIQFNGLKEDETISALEIKRLFRDTQYKKKYFKEDIKLLQQLEKFSHKKT